MSNMPAEVELMPVAKVVEKLTTPKGREQLEAYAATVQGHAHLSQYTAAAENTFVRALLFGVLERAALAVASNSPKLLSATNLLEPLTLAPSVTPRPESRVLRITTALPAIQKMLTTHGVKAYERDSTMELLSNEYHSFLEKTVLSYRSVSDAWEEKPTHSLAALLDLWDAFEDVIFSGANEQTGRNKQMRCLHDVLAYLFSMRGVDPLFVDRALQRNSGDWNDFVAQSGAPVGVLAAVALSSPLSAETWAIVEARAKHDFRDALLMTVAHPSIPLREAGRLEVEARIPYLENRDFFYSLAEVASRLSDSLAGVLLLDVRRTIRDAWAHEEIVAWEEHLQRWNHRSLSASKPRKDALRQAAMMPAEAQPPRVRWWQRQV